MTAPAFTNNGLPVSENHQRSVDALAFFLVGIVNGSNSEPAVILDALFNVYLQAAEGFGQTQHVAAFMVSVGTKLLDLQAADPLTRH